MHDVYDDAPIEDDVPSGPPEDLTSLLREHPGLLIAGGLALGLLAGALIPRQPFARTGKSLGQKALSFATAAGAMGLEFSKQARTQVEHATRESKDKLEELSSVATQTSQRAMETASSAGTDLRNLGMDLAKKTVELALKTRR
ncbi:MAG: hypothetical protein WCY11_16300 [Novosphingobium sp.]